MTHDPVNHPQHYTAGPVECIEAIRAALGDEGFVAYCRGAAIKYAWRAGRKSLHAEDLRKGAWYLVKAAEVLDLRPPDQLAILHHAPHAPETKGQEHLGRQVREHLPRPERVDD